MIKRHITLILTCIIFISIVMVNGAIKAENTVEDDNISIYTLGDEGQTVLVRGREESVADHLEVEGYETTNYLGTGFVEYREWVHNAMIVTTNQGSTEGYCMQPYVVGPNSDTLTDYKYEAGLENSSIFKSLTDAEKDVWMTSFVVATKYGFGGYCGDPNNSTGRNEHDGGSYGTYVISESGQLRAVRGLMVGGKVYEMTPGEARSLTQVVVHYVGNRNSTKNITSVKGFTNPDSTAAAFLHFKAYADGAVTLHDTYYALKPTCIAFDSYQATMPYQNMDWYIYDYDNNKWTIYNNQSIGGQNVDSKGTIKLKLDYNSRNICNKIISNSSKDKVLVKYDYSPFILDGYSTSQGYYDYFTINSSNNIPITVTYSKILSGKKSITNEMIGMTYDLDTFSQSAIVEVKLDDINSNGGKLNLWAYTGEGASAGLCYDGEIGKYCTKMYSSPLVQDCLFLGSNQVVELNSSREISIDVTGKLSLNKVSANEEITRDNPCYDMSGATYNVYKVNSDTDTDKSVLAGTFIMDSSGEGKVEYSKYNQGDISDQTLTMLPVGWYMICEEKAPTNGSYGLSKEMYYVNITKENYMEVQNVMVNEQPVHDPIGFQLIKECSEGENVGDASLSGAHFTVEYYKQYYDTLDELENVEADRTWVLETQYNEETGLTGCILHPDYLVQGSDELYYDKKGTTILPLGTIVVRETKAPDGYNLDGATYNIVNTIDGSKQLLDGYYMSKIAYDLGTVKLLVGNKILIEEKPIRGDFEFLKVEAYTQKPLANIPFLVTSKTTGESHIIVTDSNGIASTASKHKAHSFNTNGNDNYSQDDESLIPTGVWFSGNEKNSKLDDGHGALPYDTYIIKEMPCLANKDYYLADEFEVTISSDGQVTNCNVVENIKIPFIKTQAFDGVDMDKIVESNTDITLLDKVYYGGLVPGRRYILETKIVDKSQSKELTSNGKTVVGSTEFIPDNIDGEVDVELSFYLEMATGEELVIYEYLYDKETGELVTSHEDINCPEQTLTVQETKVMSAWAPNDSSIATGDSGNLKLAVVALTLSLLGISLVVNARRVCHNEKMNN